MNQPHTAPMRERARCDHDGCEWSAVAVSHRRIERREVKHARETGHTVFVRGQVQRVHGADE